MSFNREVASPLQFARGIRRFSLFHVGSNLLHCVLLIAAELPAGKLFEIQVGCSQQLAGVLALAGSLGLGHARGDLCFGIGSASVGHDRFGRIRIRAWRRLTFSAMRFGGGRNRGPGRVGGRLRLPGWAGRRRGLFGRSRPIRCILLGRVRGCRRRRCLGSPLRPQSTCAQYGHRTVRSPKRSSNERTDYEKNNGQRHIELGAGGAPGD